MNNKFFNIMNPKYAFNLWFIFLLLGVFAYEQRWKIVIPGTIVFIFILFNHFRLNIKTKKQISHYIENLTFNMDLASKDTLVNFPMPLLVIEVDGTIVWYNSKFKSLFMEPDLLEKTAKKISNKLGDKFYEKYEKDDIKIEESVFINDEYYNILGNLVKKSKDNDEFIVSLYFINNTDYTQLKRNYNNEKISVCVILVDNYDELMQGIDDSKKPHIIAEINKIITDWATSTNGILKSFERDKYIFIFERQYLKTFQEKKFDILDTIKEIDTELNVPITLSMGLGINGEKFVDNLRYANAAIDIALGRGGDQVVIKNRDAISFYGGKTRELEKKTRVKARVIAYALRELIDQAPNVLVMGHSNCDIDALGAALGIYRIAKNRNKEVNIVLSFTNPTIDNIVSMINDDIDYEDIFLSKSEALERMNESTLLVIVDTHRPSFTEAPEVLNKAKQVVVIDHHRRGRDFVKDAVLTYQETYASSTCELVTEILQYVEEKIKLKSIEAEALFAGIVVDTKNFTFKTGVRTFEAAANLRRQGVDTLAVKQLFHNDLDTYLSISDIIKTSELYNKTIAISVCPYNKKNSQLISAKAADQLIGLSGISAAFVMGKLSNEVFISGRSSGSMNVQVVLEKLGGGGHMTVAGAQLADCSIDEAKKMLKGAISEYLESEKNVNSNI
jgi:c-di-AMP phosphodiesterase-like protein